MNRNGRNKDEYDFVKDLILDSPWFGYLACRQSDSKNYVFQEADRRPTYQHSIKSISAATYTDFRKIQANIGGVTAIGIASNSGESYGEVMAWLGKVLTLLDGDIPFQQPTFVQYDTCIRLIWVFASPFILKGVKGAKRRNAIKVLNDIASKLSDAVTFYLGERDVKFRPLSLGTDIPFNGVSHSAGREVWHAESKQWEWQRTFSAQTQTIHLGDYISFQSLYDSVLEFAPECTPWSTVNHPLHLKRCLNIKNVLSRRREILIFLAQKAEGNLRSTIIHEYSNICRSLHYSSDRVGEECRALNNIFPTPLSPTALKSCLTGRAYRIADDEFYKRIGRPGLSRTKTAKERAAQKREYAKAAYEPTKRRNAREKERKKKKAKELQAKKLSVSAISKKMGISRNTVYSYLKEEVV